MAITDTWANAGSGSGWQTLTTSMAVNDGLGGVTGFGPVHDADAGIIIDLDVYMKIVGNTGIQWEIQVGEGEAVYTTIEAGQFGIGGHGGDDVHRAMQHLRATYVPDDYTCCLWVRFRFKEDGGGGSAYIHKEKIKATIMEVEDIFGAPSCR